MNHRDGNPLDPMAILKQAFEMGDQFPGPAEDLLLSWLLSLGGDQNPAAAAATLLPLYAGSVAGMPELQPIAKLHRLLADVAASPPAIARRGRLSARTRRGSGDA